MHQTPDGIRITSATPAHGSGRETPPWPVPADRTKLQAMRAKVSRLLERERLRGLAGHWSYDFNRHVALRQLRDRLAAQ